MRISLLLMVLSWSAQSCTPPSPEKESGPAAAPPSTDAEADIELYLRAAKAEQKRQLARYEFARECHEKELAKYKRHTRISDKDGLTLGWIDSQTGKETDDVSIRLLNKVEMNERIREYESKVEAAEQSITWRKDHLLDITPQLQPLDMKIGDLGVLGVVPRREEGLGAVRTFVSQIIDDSNMLAYATVGDRGHGAARSPSFWITGISTIGLVDDQQFKTSDLFWVSGTKRYTSLAGPRTVLLLERFEVDMARVAERLNATSRPAHP